MVVLGGSAAPENISSELRDAEWRTDEAHRPGAEDSRSFASADDREEQFKYHEVNGEIHGRRMGGEIYYDASFLVQIPRSKDSRSLLSDSSRQPADPQRMQNLPPTLQGYQEPDPTLGALRSLGGK